MLDPTTFQYADSRAQDIFLHLEEAGKSSRVPFEVYFPGVKEGECFSPYVVVKNNGSNAHANFSTDVDLYSVMCYVPKLQYSRLEPLVQVVKEAMKALEPMIKPNGIQTPSFYDDAYKAHMVSIEYKNYKKQ